MAVFDRCFVSVKGSVLGMASGGTLEGQGDPLPVDTMTTALAGVTPVPQHMVLSTDMYVPQTGFEFDAFKAWIETTELSFRVQFAGGGQSVYLKGYMHAPSLKWGAADHSMLSWKALVSAVPFT